MEETQGGSMQGSCTMTTERLSGADSADEQSLSSSEERGKPRVKIRYCTQCHCLLCAAWPAQELLSTFAGDLGEVALEPATGGVFEVRAGGKTLWSRAVEGRFPEAKELKQRVRDIVAPERDLGHSDR